MLALLDRPLGAQVGQGHGHGSRDVASLQRAEDRAPHIFGDGDADEVERQTRRREDGDRSASGPAQPVLSHRVEARDVEASGEAVLHDQPR